MVLGRGMNPFDRDHNSLYRPSTFVRHEMVKVSRKGGGVSETVASVLIPPFDGTRDGMIST